MSFRHWIIVVFVALGGVGCTTDCIRNSDCSAGYVCGPVAHCIVVDAGVDLGDSDLGDVDLGAVDLGNDVDGATTD